jgi:non-haem Fe2+, alpha-ketoglutarate-dependent halogenase
LANSLRPHELEAYERDGVVWPIDVLSGDEVTSFRSRFEELAAALGGRPGSIGRPHLHFGWAFDLATHPAVLDAVEGVLGPDLLIHGTLILCKWPHDPSFVSWHQDGTYSGLHATPTTSAWIALSESTPESGCMRCVRGSHRQPILEHVETFAANNLLSHGQEVTMSIREDEALDLVLAPGQMSLHQNNIVHGSGPNRSGSARIGFIIRYVTPALAESATPVVRARGNADLSHLDLTGRPQVDQPDAALAAYREAVRRREILGRSATGERR